MAYTIKMKGMAEISESLSKMADRAPKAAAKALFEGAGIISGELRKSAEAIKTEKYQRAKAGETRLASPEEKAVVLKANTAGIAKFDRDGTEIKTSIGYGKSGYAKMAGKKVPIAKIANSINHGTSFMEKQNFIRKAALNGKAKAEARMKELVETELLKDT